MVNFTLNGAARAFDGDENMPLLWYLRDDLQLTGTKFGCGIGSCGQICLAEERTGRHHLQSSLDWLRDRFDPTRRQL